MSMLTVARCRTAQTFARLGRRLHPVRKQRVETGAGALFSVGQLLRDGCMKKPMAVLGSGSEALRSRLLRALKESDIACVVWDKLSRPPKAEEAEQMSQLWRQEGCDCFIALGDGPVIDAAKAAAARCARRGRSVMDMVGFRRVRRRLPPVVAIPTVAGSGAEALPAAVIADEQGIRFIMEDEVLMPAAAILDPELLAEASRESVADAGMDGLCRAVETYLAVPSGDRKMKNQAAQAVELFLNDLPLCWNSGGDLKARENMLLASRIAAAGRGCGYVRAMCRAAQTVCGMSFAQSCGVLLPAVLERYGSAAARPLAELAAAVHGACGSAADRSAALIAVIRGMVFRMGLPDTLEGVTGDEAASIADMAAAMANPRYVSPVVWTAEELTAVLKNVCVPQD